MKISTIVLTVIVTGTLAILNTPTLFLSQPTHPRSRAQCWRRAPTRPWRSTTP